MACLARRMSETPTTTTNYFPKKNRNTPPICIAIRLRFVPHCFWCPICSEEREILSVLLPFVSQYVSHLYCNTAPICIAMLLGKSLWLWSPECSPPRVRSSSSFIHWEIKGRFRKRVVLANVPSFRFSFRGNIRRNHPFGNHPFVNTKKGSLGDKRAVS